MAHTISGKQENPYRKWQIRIFSATWLAYAGYYFCRQPFFIVKADLAQSFNLSPVEIAHLGTSYLAAYMIGQFSSAFIGKRLGPRLLLLAGMAIPFSRGSEFGQSFPCRCLDSKLRELIKAL